MSLGRTVNWCWFGGGRREGTLIVKQKVYRVPSGDLFAQTELLRLLHLPVDRRVLAEKVPGNGSAGLGTVFYGL